MNSIQNSKIKETYRLNNEKEALKFENERNIQLNNQIAQLRLKKKFTFGPFIFLGFIIGIAFAGSGWGGTGFLVGLILGSMLCPIANVLIVSEHNRNVEEEKQKMIDLAQLDIKSAYMRSDQKTKIEIDAYDRAVQAYCQKILKNADTIDAMVDHVTNMFQRMVSHADAGSHMRFIEADFIFDVKKTGIVFHYQSRYTNPQDDYNFNKARYRDLNADTECEGLAQALTKLTIIKMKGLYPPNSLNISVSHNDAAVTMHFKAANKNFVAARDII